MPVNDLRLEQANAILDTYSRGSRLKEDRGRLYFAWTDWQGKPQRKLWHPQTRGSDYPACRGLPFGGTCTVATMELYRWARLQPVRPLSFWQLFAKYGGAKSALDLAVSFGWPERVPCVFCGRLLGVDVGWDLYDRTGYPVGPGCWYGEGCQDERKAAG